MKSAGAVYRNHIRRNQLSRSHFAGGFWGGLLLFTWPLQIEAGCPGSYKQPERFYVTAS
jgi:hypothetical protein